MLSFQGLGKGKNITTAQAPASIQDTGEITGHDLGSPRLPTTPRVRVAILDHTAILGGGEIALLNLARSIDPGRYDLLVILFSDGPLRARLEANSIATVVVPLDPRIVDVRKDNIGGGTLLRLRDLWCSVKFVWRLSRELRRRKIEIVHTNSLKSDLLGGVAGRLAFIPVIWHVRDRIAVDYLPGKVVTAFRLLARLIPRRVIANSDATLRTLRIGGEGPIDKPGFTVVHDGAEVFDQPRLEPKPDGQLTVGLVGRISPWKGQHIFLEAISLIRSKYPQARFQIIGAALFSESDYESRMRELAVLLRVDDIVDFMGFRTDVAALVDRMDVLVHASTIGEPFGQVVLEGMAAGKPVVATRGGGVPEFVDDERTGLLVPMGDAPAMGQAIGRLLESPQLRKDLGTRARRHVIDGFTINHTAGNVQKVYEDIIVVRRK